MKNKFYPFQKELLKLSSTLITELQQAEQRNEIVIFSEPSLGFFVAKPIPRKDHLILFVWVGISRIKNGITHALPMIEDMAKATQCSAIEFETTRKGFARIAQSFGFKATGKRDIYTIYTKEV